MRSGVKCSGAFRSPGRAVLRNFSLSTSGPPQPPAYPPGTPENTLLALESKGVKQALRSTDKILASSFLGGALLGWGNALSLIIAGGCAGALATAPGALALMKGLLFPTGLAMIVLSGSDLLTGNFLTQSLPPWTAERAWPASRVLLLSAAGNMAGSLVVAGGLIAGGLLPEGSQIAAYIAHAAEAKCALSPMAVFVRGIGANWMVGMAIFQATSETSPAGKVAALWMPIATFVALGMEHSVANMFLLPCGAACGAHIGVSDIVTNLAPAMLGNACGTALFVGAMTRRSLFGK